MQASPKDADRRAGSAVRYRAATLRYYERRGLVSPPARTPAGYRSYTPESAVQLRLIGWAKGLGFTFREIREMTGAIGQHAAGRGDRVRAQVRAKMAEVDLKMRRLASIRAQLQDLAACRCKDECPVIERVVAGTSSLPTRRKRDDSVSVRLTGDAGVKQFIAAEMGITID